MLIIYFKKLLLNLAILGPLVFVLSCQTNSEEEPIPTTDVSSSMMSDLNTEFETSTSDASVVKNILEEMKAELKERGLETSTDMGVLSKNIIEIVLEILGTKSTLSDENKIEILGLSTKALMGFLSDVQSVTEIPDSINGIIKAVGTYLHLADLGTSKILLMSGRPMNDTSAPKGPPPVRAINHVAEMIMVSLNGSELEATEKSAIATKSSEQIVGILFPSLATVTFDDATGDASHDTKRLVFIESTISTLMEGLLVSVAADELPGYLGSIMEAMLNNLKATGLNQEDDDPHPMTDVIENFLSNMMINVKSSELATEVAHNISISLADVAITSLGSSLSPIPDDHMVATISTINLVLMEGVQNAGVEGVPLSDAVKKLASITSEKSLWAFNQRGLSAEELKALSLELSEAVIAQLGVALQPQSTTDRNDLMIVYCSELSSTLVTNLEGEGAIRSPSEANEVGADIIAGTIKALQTAGMGTYRVAEAAEEMVEAVTESSVNVMINKGASNSEIKSLLSDLPEMMISKIDAVLIDDPDQAILGTAMGKIMSGAMATLKSKMTDVEILEVLDLVNAGLTTSLTNAGVSADLIEGILEDSVNAADEAMSRSRENFTSVLNSMDDVLTSGGYNASLNDGITADFEALIQSKNQMFSEDFDETIVTAMTSIFATMSKEQTLIEDGTTDLTAISLNNIALLSDLSGAMVRSLNKRVDQEEIPSKIELMLEELIGHLDELPIQRDPSTDLETTTLDITVMKEITEKTGNALSYCEEATPTTVSNSVVMIAETLLLELNTTERDLSADELLIAAADITEAAIKGAVVAGLSNDIVPVGQAVVNLVGKITTETLLTKGLSDADFKTQIGNMPGIMIPQMDDAVPEENESDKINLAAITGQIMAGIMSALENEMTPAELGEVGNSVNQGIQTGLESTGAGDKVTEVQEETSEIVADAQSGGAEDDAPDIKFSKETVETLEASTDTDSFGVSLTAKPDHIVTMTIESLNTQEGTVTPGILYFTPANWSVEQLVTVNDVDDDYVDGDVEYQISVYSDNGVYKTIQAKNKDNDKIELHVTAPNIGTVYTSEVGGQAHFIIKMMSRPKVRMLVGWSVDPEIYIQGLTSQVMYFDPALSNPASNGWNTPRTMKVTGKALNPHEPGQEHKTAMIKNVVMASDSPPGGIKDTDYEGLRESVMISVKNLDYGPVVRRVTRQDSSTINLYFVNNIVSTINNELIYENVFEPERIKLTKTSVQGRPHWVRDSCTTSSNQIRLTATTIPIVPGPPVIPASFGGTFCISMIGVYATSNNISSINAWALAQFGSVSASTVAGGSTTLSGHNVQTFNVTITGASSALSAFGSTNLTINSVFSNESIGNGTLAMPTFRLGGSGTSLSDPSHFPSSVTTATIELYYVSRSVTTGVNRAQFTYGSAIPSGFWKMEDNGFVIFKESGAFSSSRYFYAEF